MPRQKGPDGRWQSGDGSSSSGPTNSSSGIHYSSKGEQKAAEGAQKVYEREAAHDAKMAPKRDEAVSAEGKRWPGTDYVSGPGVGTEVSSAGNTYGVNKGDVGKVHHWTKNDGSGGPHTEAQVRASGNGGAMVYFKNAWDKPGRLRFVSHRDIVKK